MKCPGGCCHLLLLSVALSSALSYQKTLCFELSPEEVPANAMEPLTERLVKQSKLLAEESRVEGAAVSIVEAPKHFESGWPSRKVSLQDDQTGGPGDTYISMASDGSARYRFGFDTKQASGASRGSAPRLMREESRLEDGTVVGRYGYTDPFGVFRIVQYVAGPEGYFASEHVGALGEAGDKAQLNKQLRNAIELARRRRLASEHPAGQHQHQERRTRESSSNRGAATSTITFATTINHIVGSNGRSYSTAFRPTNLGSSSSFISRQQPHREPIEMRHQQLGPSSISPVYESSRARHGEAVRASPAWSVLSNTYNDQELPLIINHGSTGPEVPASTLLAAPSVGSGFEQEFSEHAAKLVSIQQQTSGALGQPLDFGARAAVPQHTSVYLSPGSELSPPLYHPEVHMADSYQHSAKYVNKNRESDTTQTNYAQLSHAPARKGVLLTRNVNLVQEHPVRYATRLSALASLRQQQENGDELSMEASEQVQTNTTSRAKIPDRSKKLSAILKPRNHSAANEDQAKIKRPKPLNIKRQNLKPTELPSDTTTVAKTQETLVEFSAKPSNIGTQVEKKFDKLTSKASSGAEFSGDSVPDTKLQSASESSPGITLIDTIQTNADLLYDKELYEKIVRIQQEIAAKSLSSHPSPDVTTEVSFNKLDLVSNSTLTTSKTLISTTSVESSTLEPKPTPSTTTAAANSATSGPRGNLTTFVAQYLEPVLQHEKQLKKINIVETLPTGPLLFMDSSVDQDELMANFTLDLDPFDSSRGFTSEHPILVQTDNPIVKSPDVNLANQQQPKVIMNSAQTTTQSPRLTTVVTTIVPYVVSGNASTSTSESPPVSHNTTLKQLSDETTTSSPTLPTTTIDLHETTSSATLTSTTTTTNSPTTTKIFNVPEIKETVPQFTSSTISPPTTTTVSSVSTTSDNSNVTTASTTTTSTSASISTSTSTQAPSSLPKFGQPRFGRLVIKREGKVVARYNGTDPIPDSLIPIGTGLVGSGSESGEALIVPDMPRMSMRRAVKRKAGPLLSSVLFNNTTTTTTESPSSSSTTKDPLLSDASDWSPIRQSFKRRGIRSSMLDSKESQDLAESEGAKGSEVGVGEVRAKRFTSYRRARSWSDRIRGNAIPPPPANISYEPKEELRKMVDKIEKRLMISVSPENTSKPSIIEVTSVTPSPQLTNQPAKQSKSSSATFTIPLSITQKANSQLVDFNPNQQIQLRHNQSLTVHVDLEPPGMPQSSVGLSGDNRISRRLVNRDIQASDSTVSPRDDMLRLRKSPSPALEQTAGRTMVSKTIQEIKEATMGRKRNARMLCIEVDGGASIH